jgi:hypothetical protein
MSLVTDLGFERVAQQQCEVLGRWQQRCELEDLSLSA